MATIDVAGRTLKESHGKARVAQPKGNRLVPSDFGLVPSSAHMGVTPEPRGKALAELSPARQHNADSNVVAHTATPLAVKRSKKPAAHVGVSQSSDMQVKPKKQNPMAQSKGVEGVLSSQGTDCPRPQTAPSSNGVRMRHMTAEQQAKRKLERLATENPTLQNVIEQELKVVSKTGGEAVVDFERRIQRHLAVEEVRLRNKQLQSGAAPKRDSLGEATNLVLPFAVGDSVAAKEQTKHSHRKNYALQTAMQREDERAKNSQSPYRLGRKVMPSNHTSATPFDTASFSGEAYPEPPSVGVTAQQKLGKGHVAVSRVQGNIDEQLQKHAIARCARYQGNGVSSVVEDDARPLTAQGKRSTTLLEQQEQRCKDREDRAVTTRRGRQVAPQNYRPTSLW